MLATEEDWLTEDDLYDLNFAFVYAAGSMHLDFNYETFDLTVATQYETLEQEASEQPQFDTPSEEEAEAADAEQQRKEALSERD